MREALEKIRKIVSRGQITLNVIDRIDMIATEALEKGKFSLSDADINHRLNILVEIYNLVGADDVQCIDRIKEMQKEITKEEARLIEAKFPA
jgi:hypothetical protein